MPELSVAIVVFQPDWAQLARTLRALGAAAARLPADARVSGVRILEQGAEAEGEQPALAARAASLCHQSVSWLAQRDNTGFGRGHNRLATTVDSTWHLILNPDTELAPDALAVAWAYAAAHPRATLLAPRGVDEAGRPLWLCKRYPSVRLLWLRGFAPAWLRRRAATRLARYEARDLATAAEPSTDFQMASGCCQWVRTAAFKAVGGFDTGYFLYFEDFDLSLRLRRLGPAVYLPAMRVLHHGGRTARKGWRHVYWFVRSGCRFFSRHGWVWW